MRHRRTTRHHSPPVCRATIALGLWISSFLWLTTGAARAQTAGKLDYDRNCAVCHGADGKGRGEAVRVLAGLEPTDLTQLSRKNAGKFPVAVVYRAIDGRDQVSAHHLGHRRMPMWGLDFQLGSERSPGSEARLKQRISALVSYVETLQEK